MIYGITKLSPMGDVPADSLWMAPVVATEDGLAVKVTLPLDGLGSAVGSQAFRGVIYEGKVGGALLAQSAEVTIADGAALAWVDFSFLTADPRGIPLTKGSTYYIGVQAGPTGSAARFSATGTQVGITDTYSNGPGATVGSAPSTGLTAFLTTTRAYVPLPTVSEQMLASLPVPDAVAYFGTATGPDRSTAARASCGWHGTKFAEEQGAFAIVKLDGLLSDFVGERVQIRHDDRITYAYVYDERDIAEDISVTRRLFMELADPTDDELEVTVTAMGASL